MIKRIIIKIPVVKNYKNNNKLKNGNYPESYDFILNLNC